MWWYRWWQDPLLMNRAMLKQLVGFRSAGSFRSEKLRNFSRLAIPQSGKLHVDTAVILQFIPSFPQIMYVLIAGMEALSKIYVLKP